MGALMQFQLLEDCRVWWRKGFVCGFRRSSGVSQKRDVRLMGAKDSSMSLSTPYVSWAQSLHVSCVCLAFKVYKNTGWKFCYLG